jgi:hypothetical protein
MRRLKGNICAAALCRLSDPAEGHLALRGDCDSGCDGDRDPDRDRDRDGGPDPDPDRDLDPRRFATTTVIKALMRGAGED